MRRQLTCNTRGDMQEEEIFNIIKKFQNEFSLKDGTVEYAEDYDIVLWAKEYLEDLVNEI